MSRRYDDDDTPVVNPHYRGADGRTTLAPQIFGGDDFRPTGEPPGYPACAGADPDMFYPNRGNWHSATFAKRICKTCPIINWCRETNIGEPHGIWGGLTESQRRLIRAQRRIAATEFTYEDLDT